MRAFFRAVLDLLLPSFCLGCEKPLGMSAKPLFCPDCLAALQPVQSPLCPCCGRTYLTTGGDHHCGGCLAKPRYFNKAMALFLYEEPIRKLIQHFKYQGKTACLATVADLSLNHPVIEETKEIDLIIPVPLHHGRLRERGFNQALLLAKAIFPNDPRISSGILIRSRPTAPQAGFNGAARRANLKNAFRVGKPDRIAGKKILLVDDVLTTGTTVDECAKTLRKAGASEVMVLTLARVKEDY